MSLFTPALSLGAVGLLLALSGCGGGGGGGACGAPSCGGDPTGTWSLTSACLEENALRQAFLQGSMGNCAQATVSANITPSGTITYNADLTYALAVTLSGSTTVNIPTSCLSGATCAQLSAALQTEVSSNPTIQSASCSGTSTCACVETLTPQPTSEAGTYAKSGSSLTTMPTGGTAETDSFCVSGMTLTLGTPTSTGTMATFVSTVTARKQ